MSTPQLPQHISQQFQHELEDVRARVLEMGGLVENQLNTVLEALSTERPDLAEYVRSGDYQVNNLHVSIDEECTEILARRQPAASDLRMVLTVIRITNDLERMGDEIAKMGRMFLQLFTVGCPRSSYIGVLGMGRHVQWIVKSSLDTFARMDSKAALSIAREDKKIDQEYDAIMRQLVTYMMEDPRKISHILNIIWAVRALERIGDHASNICESVIYLVEGKDIRHTQYGQVTNSGSGEAV